MIVHFPIALLSVSFVLDLVGIALRKEDLGKAAWWMFLCGAIGLAGAITSGLLAEQTVAIPPSVASRFETHEEMAFLAASLYAILLFWRISNKTGLPKRGRLLYFLLTLVALSTVWIGAWHGGELVYSAGVGVKAIP